MKKTTFIISLITTLTMIFTMAVPVRAFSWGTSAGLDAFEDMKQVDDEGTICSGRAILFS